MVDCLNCKNAKSLHDIELQSEKDKMDALKAQLSAESSNCEENKTEQAMLMIMNIEEQLITEMDKRSQKLDAELTHMKEDKEKIQETHDAISGYLEECSIHADSTINQLDQSMIFMDIEITKVMKE